MSKNDVSKNQDMTYIAKLSEYTDTTTSVIYIYSLIKHNNKIIFTSSSATKEERKKNEDLRHYFDSYDDVDPRVFEVFEKHEKRFIEYSDKRDAFRSVFLPRLAEDGTFYVVAADISISHIHDEIKKHTYHSLLISFLFIIFSIPIYIVTIKNIHRITEEKFNHESIKNQLLEKEKNEEKLITAIEIAEDASRAKSDFLSHMSHEFRTPLNAILGFSQLLAMDIGDSKKEEHDSIQEILNAGRHLLAIIDDILDTSKIESGKFDVVMEVINLDELLPQCITFVRQQADLRNITITNHISGNGYRIETDKHRFKQVILNLLTNAIKYNSEQGEITLNAEISNNKIRILISDTGTGLNEEEINKLYTPFERFNTEKNIDGTGLGLVITKTLVELMNGEIGVESTVGKGTTFWIEFKIA